MWIVSNLNACIFQPRGVCVCTHVHFSGSAHLLLLLLAVATSAFLHVHPTKPPPPHMPYSPVRLLAGDIGQKPALQPARELFCLRAVLPLLDTHFIRERQCSRTRRVMWQACEPLKCERSNKHVFGHVCMYFNKYKISIKETCP